MQRIQHPSTVAVLPDITETGDYGFYTPGDPETDTPPTTVTAAALNRIQEELVSIVVGAGLSLDAEDNGQIWSVLSHILGIESGTSSVTASNTNDRAVLVSDASTADGDHSAAVASSTVTAQGDYSFVAASGNFGHADGTRSVLLASNGGTVAATNGAALATVGADVQGTSCAVVAANDCGTASGTSNNLVVASQYTINNVSNSIAGGYAGSGPAATGNVTWRIESQGGNAAFSGTMTANGVIDSGADYAEAFPNLEPGAIPVGRLVALDGEAVRLAGEGDDVLGVVSPAPAVLGDAPQHWHGRYLRDEFGGYVLDEQGQKVVNPDYDPARPYVPRQQRPTEWTVVGLLGKLFIAVDHTVAAGEYVRPGPEGGLGTVSEEATRVRAMKVTSPYDAARGYAVARCLVI